MLGVSEARVPGGSVDNDRGAMLCTSEALEPGVVVVGGRGNTSGVPEVRGPGVVGGKGNMSDTPDV